MEWYPPTPPWATNEERLTTEALNAVATLPESEIQKIRPPMKIVPFPPKFGYRQGQPTIYDVLGVDRSYPDRRTDFSGSRGGYSGSSTPSMGFF